MSSPTVSLTRADVDLIVGWLPRCKTSHSHRSGASKVAIPSQVLADWLADNMRQIVYPCGRHWHLTTNGVIPKDVQSSPHRAVKLPALHVWAVKHGRARGVRMHIYGARNDYGQWRYIAHHADYRDTITRTI